MNGPHLTVRATRFLSSSGMVDQDDPADDETNTDGLDNGGDLPDEADGDLDFEGDEGTEAVDNSEP